MDEALSQQANPSATDKALSQPANPSETEEPLSQPANPSETDEALSQPANPSETDEPLPQPTYSLANDEPLPQSDILSGYETENEESYSVPVRRLIITDRYITEPFIGPLTKKKLQKLLRSAIKCNDEDAVRDAVWRGADVNHDNIDVSGTPLHLAAERCRVYAAEALLDLGADIESYSGAWACTPLGAAAWCDSCDMVRFLLERGASPSKGDPDGHTAMHFAASNGCVKCVQLLRDYGAEARVVAKYGRTPLHEAASIGSIPVIELLLSWGAELNAADWFGETPLGCAVTHQREAVIEFLMGKGAISRIDPESEARRLHLLKALQEQGIVSSLI
ncbi:ankyrin homolog isoform X4 [Halyomorpha halys]|uniref:ankyrin homolog isoform X4 n=1 Tax=Halyomorpha halys TaxID=286706 RepID=UPI0034D2B16D